jgi:hypothetical protein
VEELVEQRSVRLDCGILGALAKNPAGLPVDGWATFLEHSRFSQDAAASLWHSSCVRLIVSVVVFRATLLSIVLMFAAGPSASLFCKALCDPQAAAENGCHHDNNVGGSVSLSAVDSCRDSVQALAILLKEDVRRTSSLDGGCTPAIATFRFMTSPRSSGTVWNQGRAPSDLQRPLTTPLRV